MIGLAGKKKNKLYSAYTLAEMLIVMSIIMMVILSLPAMTKKVFKLEETRKSHGRYECYWETQSDGSKKLMEYLAEENGRKVTTESKNADEGVCRFIPPQNTIYFMVHAVGGGGGGAKIEEEHSDLADVEQVTTTSYLYPTSEVAYPEWVKHIISKKNTDIPWLDASGKTKSFFDVIETSKKQLVRYRLAGNAANVVSLFIPQVPEAVTLEIKPGKGGLSIDSSETDQTKGDGQDTVVTYVYSDTGSGSKRIEALRARGGAGGNTSIDAKTSVTLVGQKPGDLGLSDTAAVKTRSAGFADMTESADKFDFLKSKISYGAGDGGNGETQFISNTDGFVMYEYDNVLELFEEMRFGNHIQNITDKVSTNFYRDKTPDYNCSKSTLSEIKLKRTGQCVGTDDDTFESTKHYTQFSCAIGTNENTSTKLNESMGQMKCNDPTICSTFQVSCGESCYNGNTAPIITPNPVGEAAGVPFYNCTFEYKRFQLTCETKLTDQTVHKCTGPSASGIKCANGKDPVGSGASKKCAASGGGDGAVVILW